MKDPSELYGAEYYEGYYERSPKWFDFFNQVADALVDRFQPKTHLDAGCAWGLLVEVLRERGVESFGIDFSAYALDKVRPDVQSYCRRASLTEPIAGGPYDLVTCIEVLEHLEEPDALRAIENLTAVTDVIVFSSTSSDFYDPTHVNVQPLIYWLRAFAKHGFCPSVELDASFISEHAFAVHRSAEAFSDRALNLYAQIVELRGQARATGRHSKLRKPSAQIKVGDELLDDLQTSEGWLLINRYRSWREDLREEHPRLFEVWEGLASAGLRLAAGRPSKAHRALKTWDYAAWIARNEPNRERLRQQVQEALNFPCRPKISIVMPVYEISEQILREAVASVQAQTYDNWELCASVIPTVNPKAAALLDQLSAEDERIRVCRLDANLGISGNSHRAAALVTGDFMALLDHDDTLAPFALFETARLLNEDPSANLIYSDRDEISEDGTERLNPFFKPGWSPEILMSANYLTHFCVLRADHVREIGGWRPETDGAQDWDLFLRAAHNYGGVRHIPKVLYHWRHARSSVASTGLAGKPYAKEAQVRAIESHCRSVNLSESTAYVDGSPKIAWRLSDLPRVSVIVLSSTVGEETADKALSISNRPECELAEVICPSLSTREDSSGSVKFVGIPEDVDIVGQAHRLVESSSGEILVFVDACIDFDAGAWLRETVGPLRLPGVGLCGCHLMNGYDGAVHHVGIGFDDEGDAVSIRPSPEWAKANFLVGWRSWLRNWSAASGACFAIRRETWDDLGGFYDPRGHSRPDVQFCLKLAARGLRVVTNPTARLRQRGVAALEVPQRDRKDEDRRIVRRMFPEGDPYVNPNLRLVDGYLVPR